MTKHLSIESAQYTAAGRKPENQDFHGIVIPSDYQLASKGISIAIADGVSASEFGREASETCVNALLSDYYSTPDSWTVKTSISKVLNSINSWLFSRTHPKQYNHRTHATTLSGLVLKSNTAHIFHIGDSRIYLFRDNSLVQQSKDHRVFVSENDSYLNRAMGIDLQVEIDYKKIDLQIADIFLLTTDGIHDVLSDRQIAAILKQYQHDLNAAAKHLADQALANNSQDNLTCQLVRIKTLPDPDAEEFFDKLQKLPFPPDLSPGNQLDSYKIIRELHASSRSQCYYAYDMDSDEKLVIKTPSINYVDNPHYIQSFLQEEWIGRQIDNPHVLKVYQHKPERRFLYQIAQYIEGQNLRDWMQAHNNIDPLNVVAIIEQIAKGLRAFHRLEMVHRDLKPENIMIDKHYTVKIIDFGSTKIAGGEEILNPLDNFHLVGTVDYTAPEFLAGSSGSALSDQYSLAVICYEMLCAHLPFKPNLKRYAIHNRHYIPINEYNQQVPAWIEGAIKKALQNDPEKRYNDIDEFVYDLKHPNPDYIDNKHIPLIEKNPLKFWKSLSLLLFLLNIILITMLNLTAG